MLVLDLPLPPSVNHYWGQHGHRRYVSKAGVAFKAQVSDYVIEYRVPKLGTARIAMTVVLFPKDRRKQDIDNRIKALWDALADAGVFDNDEQIDTLFIERGEIKKNGGCRVYLDILDKIEENTPIT
jgi:crossover junction endodeoxyribonuclease RusA